MFHHLKAIFFHLHAIYAPIEIKDVTDTTRNCLDIVVA